MALSGKLSELVAAALTSNALTYHLQLSVIVKGSSGVGKMTMIRNVAQQLNLHVLEVCSSYTHSAEVAENDFSWIASMLLEKTTRRQKAFYVHALIKQRCAPHAYLC